MSASPPVLEYGCSSLLTSRILMRPRCPLMESHLQNFRAEKRAQRLGDFHAAIGLLMRFDQCHEQSRQRGAAAVEQMRETVLARRSLVAQVHAAWLIVLAVRAARHFEIRPLPR